MALNVAGVSGRAPDRDTARRPRWRLPTDFAQVAQQRLISRHDRKDGVTEVDGGV